MFKRYWRVMLFVVLLVVGMGLPVLAMAQTGDGQIPSFNEFLIGLSGPLISGAVAVALSWLVEYIPQYEQLAAKWKRLCFLGMCLFLPLAAASLRALLGYVAWSFDPLLWHAIVAGASAGGIGTLAHTRKL